MKQYNKINFIHSSIFLLQDSEILWKNNVLHRIWSQSWHPSGVVGGRIMLTTSEERINSRKLSTWRLRTPTICRRSVPTLCNAGLPEKKTLQQGKINRKTNQIVLVSTMSWLECPLLLLIEGLSITSEVFTWMPFRGTHIKTWWPPHECPRIIRPNSILVNTSQDNILFLLLQRWNCVVDWSRGLPTLTICKRSSLWCVNCPMFTLVTCNKVLTLRGKKRLLADYLCCTTKPVNWSTTTNSRSANAH